MAHVAPSRFSTGCALSQRFGGEGWDTSAFLATDGELGVYTAGLMAPPVLFGTHVEASGSAFALQLAP